MRKSESVKGLREHITNSDLRKQIDNIWNIAEKSYHPFQEGETNQGTLHCKTVEKNINQIIIDSEKIYDFNDTEYFILSAAACLHDIGKVRIPDIISNNKYWSHEKDHGKKGKFIIFERYLDLGLDRLHLIPIAEIVGFHSNGRIEGFEQRSVSINHVQINIIRLAILFRLADILHTTSDRAPEIVSKIQFSNGKTPPKVKARQGILDWYVKNKEIVLYSTPTIEEENAVIEAFGMIEKDLEGIKPYLISYGFPDELHLEINDSLINFEYLQKTENNNTFQGMAFYTEDEASFFKGRDKETQDLLNNVFINPVSLLIGESGAGKTSLVRAGLFPRLLLHQWKCVWVRPLDDSLLNIKNNIWFTAGSGSPPSNSSLKDIITVAADRCRPHTILIVFDQFEDILKDTANETYNEIYYALAATLTRPPLANALYSNLKILIVFRDDAFVKIESKLLKSITGSNRSLPLVGLQQLTRAGAKQAIITGLERAQKEFQSETGEKPLIEIILDDLQKGTDRIFPPYLQIIIEALARKTDSSNPFITSEIYYKLGGSDAIISRYLIDRLIEFGPQQDLAKNILKALTSSSGDKDQKTINELNELTLIDLPSIRTLLKKLIDLRMIRDLGNDSFEIIHDYLGKIIDKELISDEERDIKYIHKQLQSYFEQYQKHGAPILSTSFLANLYRYRRAIRIHEKYYELLILTCISETSLGWYWIKNLNIEKIRIILLRYINHEDPTIQQNAMRLIIRSSISDNHKFLCQLLNHKDENFREKIIDVLTEIVTHNDLQIFTDLLNNKNKEIRKVALAMLGKIATHNDLQMITNFLNDKDKENRKIAFESFGEIANHDDIQIITNFLNDKEKDIRKLAETTIKRVEQKRNKSIISDFWIKSDEPHHVIESLLSTDKEAISDDVPRLIDLLMHADDETGRTMALDLSNLASKDDIPIFINLLDSNSVGIRRVAVKIIGKIATYDDLKTFIKLLEDKDDIVRKVAVKIIGKLATHDDLQIFIKLLKNKKWIIRSTAVDIMGRFATHEDLYIFTKLLNDKNEHIRSTAVEIMGRSATHDDLYIFTKLLNDKNEYIRRTVVDIIGRLATHEDLHIFTKLLLLHEDDQDHYTIRRKAIDTMGRLATHDDIQIFTKLLSDKNEYLRRKAVDTVGRLATHDDIQIFTKLLDHFDDIVRIYAISVLIRIITPQDLDTLLDHLALNAMGWTPGKQRAFKSLSRLDEKYYCPFPSEMRLETEMNETEMNESLFDFDPLEELSLEFDELDNTGIDSLIVYE